jgi:hypothetical protein
MSKDISFCKGELEAIIFEDISHIIDCPLKDTCYRNYNLPEVGWFITAEYNYNSLHCPNFWRVKK